MTFKINAATGLLVGVMLVAYAVALPWPAFAADCNAFVSIHHVAGTEPAPLGQIIRIQLVLWSGSITNDDASPGQLTFSHVRYDLDCNDVFSLGLSCTDEGNTVNYQGNITSVGCFDATSTAVTFTADSTAGFFNPNEVTFTPSLPVVINTNTPEASGCKLEFDVQVSAYSVDFTPDEVEAVGGYRIAAGVPDAQCSNGLASTQSQGTSIQLLPPTPTPTDTPTDTPTVTPTLTATPTNTPTVTPPNTLTATPTNTARCGDGVVTAPETCDPPGGELPPNGNPCRADCTYCGDGIVQPSETCDDGNTNNNDRCHNNCTRHLKNDPAWIRFRSGRQLTDQLKVHGNFEADHVVDPTRLVVGVRLSNADGVIYTAYLPVGAMTQRKTKARTFFHFRDPSAKSNPNGGLVSFRVTKDAHWYRVNALAYGDMSQATTPAMTMEVFFGAEQYTSLGNWRKTRMGWSLLIR